MHIHELLDAVAAGTLWAGALAGIGGRSLFAPIDGTDFSSVRREIARRLIDDRMQVILAGATSLGTALLLFGFMRAPYTIIAIGLASWPLLAVRELIVAPRWFAALEGIYYIIFENRCTWDEALRAAKRRWPQLDRDIKAVAKLRRLSDERERETLSQFERIRARYPLRARVALAVKRVLTVLKRAGVFLGA